MSGCSLEELGAHDEVGGDELAVGPQVASSTRTLPPPSWIRRVAHGSGTQAPSMSPALKAVSVSALACGMIDDVAAAGGVGR